MDKIIRFTPDRTGRELVVQYSNGESFVYPQVGWILTEDADGNRYIEPGVYNGDVDRVETPDELLPYLPTTGRTSEWRGEFG